MGTKERMCLGCINSEEERGRKKSKDAVELSRDSSRDVKESLWTKSIQEQNLHVCNLSIAFSS